LSQMFMFPGKLALEKESVLRSKHMLESEQFEKAVEILNEVRMNYYDLYSIQWKLEVNNESQLLMKTFLSASEAKYTVGKGMQQEVFKAQIEYSRLTNEEFILRQQRKNIFSGLAKNTKIILDENTKISFSDINTDYLLDKNSFNFDERGISKLIDYALEHRADIKTLKNKILMNKTDIEMARLSMMPDFSLKVGYKIF